MEQLILENLILLTQAVKSCGSQIFFGFLILAFATLIS